jgi:hypothetical protein
MSTELTNAATQNALMANRFIPYTDQLTATIAANGNSATIPWIGGNGYFTAQGTFGGGIIKLQFSTDSGTTWSDIGALTTLAASGGGMFENLPKCSLRVNLAGATTPSIFYEVGRAND